MNHVLISRLKMLNWVVIALLIWFLLVKWNDRPAPEVAISEAQGELTIPKNINTEGEDGDTSLSGSPQLSEPLASQDAGLVINPTTASDNSLVIQQNGIASDKPSIVVTTPKLDLLISLEEGSIERIRLPQYKVTQESNQSLTLLSNQHPTYYRARIGILNPKTMALRFTSQQTHWTLEEGEDQLKVTLTATAPGDYEVNRHYVFNSDSYAIEVTDEIKNLQVSTQNFSPFASLTHHVEAPDSDGTFGAYTFFGPAWFSDETPYNKESMDELVDGPIAFNVQGGWIALIQHYFLGAIIPNADSLNSYQLRHRSSGNLNIMGVVSPSLAIESGQQQSNKVTLYFGPKDQYVLEDISKGLDLTVDYGWLWWIGQPLYWGMYQIENITGNWGLAIILLTVLIKLIIFPLSAMGYRSMAKIRMLAPKIEAISKSHVGDRQKIATETLELYKKEGANPLGGCLPMLVPVPIFLALYWVILESVELRHAPFALWLQDLSSPDPFFILPILMGVSMYFVQKLSPTPATMDPIQKKILQSMPIVFTAFSLFFPSGLVLYWLVNNLLSLAQQTYIYRQLDKEGLK